MVIVVVFIKVIINFWSRYFFGSDLVLGVNFILWGNRMSCDEVLGSRYMFLKEGCWLEYFFRKRCVKIV